MTTKNINGREVVFVEVPGGMLLFKISGNNYICYRQAIDDKWETYFDDKLPEGNYSIIGKASDISEEQWAGIVEGHKFDFMDARRNRESAFKYYLDDEKIVNTAEDSGLSLLSSLGMKPGTTLLLIKEK